MCMRACVASALTMPLILCLCMCVRPLYSFDVVAVVFAIVFPLLAVGNQKYFLRSAYMHEMEQVSTIDVITANAVGEIGMPDYSFAVLDFVALSAPTSVVDALSAIEVVGKAVIGCCSIARCCWCCVVAYLVSTTVGDHVGICKMIV